MRPSVNDVHQPTTDRKRCMTCKDAPGLDVLWKEGSRRAWFCQKCFFKWAGQYGDQITQIADLQGSEAPPAFSLGNMGKESDRPMTAPIIAKAMDKQVAYGLILRPNVPDAQGDIYTESEVEKAAHRYMARSAGRADWLHRQLLSRTEAVLVESFVAPAPFDWSGFKVLKGDWLGAMWIPDPDKWQLVKSGQIRAFSIKGTGRRIPLMES